MKLSYSIHGWSGGDWAGFCAAAAETHVQGVEIDSVHNQVLQTKTSPIDRKSVV